MSAMDARSDVGVVGEYASSTPSSVGFDTGI